MMVKNNLIVVLLAILTIIEWYLLVAIKQTIDVSEFKFPGFKIEVQH